MDLVVDLGNTNYKAAFFKDRKIIQLEVMSRNDFIAFSHFIREGKFESAILSSVVIIPEEILKAINYSASKVIILNEKIKSPLINHYESPETLGPDRLALAVAGKSKYPKYPVLVIDAGSCITYDFITPDDHYLGGAISPGIDMRFKSLNEYTGKLPLIEKQNIEFIIGKTTSESILSGVINAVIFEIEGFIKSYLNSYNDLKIVLSGGDSIFLANKLKNCNFAEPNLLLYGLEEILFYQHS